jgi:hypothetical protein
VRTNRTHSWLIAVGSVALLSMAGLHGCDSGGGGGGRGNTGGSGDEETGGTGGKASTGGSSGKADAGATGGSMGNTGGSMGNTGGSMGNTGGSTGGSMGNTGGAGGSTGGAGGSTGGSMGSTGGAGGATGGAGGSMGNLPPGATKLAKHVLTWYTFQDNTPVNSLFSASGRPLKPFLSVAVPRRELKANGGTLSYGDKLYVAFLDGKTMPNGMKHTGWVQIDDFCGDGADDSYCYQQITEGKFPNVDLYIGDFTKTGIKASATGDCSGPAGSGQELTDLYTGNPGALFKTDYGGAALGSGKCGDQNAARMEQKGTTAPGEGGCWGYDGQEEGKADCANCTIGVTCAAR